MIWRKGLSPPNWRLSLYSTLLKVQYIGTVRGDTPDAQASPFLTCSRICRLDDAGPNKISAPNLGERTCSGVGDGGRRRRRRKRPESCTSDDPIVTTMARVIDLARQTSKEEENNSEENGKSERVVGSTMEGPKSDVNEWVSEWVNNINNNNNNNNHNHDNKSSSSSSSSWAN